MHNTPNHRMLIDIHTHIQQHSPDEHAGIVERASAADVLVMVAAGTTVEDSRAAIELARCSSAVRAGVGIHPDQIDARVSEEDLAAIGEMARHYEVAVMSEVGIDFLRGVPSHRHQQDAFAAQIEIAKRESLSVVFHVREPGDDLSVYSARDVALGILKEMGVGEVGGAAHYFQGDYDYARRVLDVGLHISLAKPLLRLPELQQVAARVPLDRIVLETDSYPQPFKRKREKWTEPRDVRQVAECLAGIKGVSYETVAMETTENARRLMRPSLSGADLEQWRAFQRESARLMNTSGSASHSA